MADREPPAQEGPFLTLEEWCAVDTTLIHGCATTERHILRRMLDRTLPFLAGAEGSPPGSTIQEGPESALEACHGCGLLFPPGALGENSECIRCLRGDEGLHPGDELLPEGVEL